MNNLDLIGRLTKEPELRYSQSGMAICRFTLAVDRGLAKDKKAEAERNNQPTADFIPVTAFGKTGELISTYVSKGQQLAVTGRIQTSSYDGQDGKRVFRTDVIADRIYFISGGNNGNSKQNTNNYQSDRNSQSLDDYGLGGDAFPLEDDDIPF